MSSLTPFHVQPSSGTLWLENIFHDAAGDIINSHWNYAHPTEDAGDIAGSLFNSLAFYMRSGDLIFTHLDEGGLGAAREDGVFVVTSAEYTGAGGTVTITDLTDLSDPPSVTGVPTVIRTTDSAAVVEAYLIAGGNYLLEDGAHDWSDLAAGIDLVEPLRLTGSHYSNVTVTIRGTALALGTDTFFLRNSLWVSGIKFVDGAVLFSVEDLDFAIDIVDIQHCWFENIGAALYENTNTPDEGSEITTLIFSHNVVKDCDSGVHLFIGNSVEPNLSVTYGQFNYNTVTGVTKYGIVVNYGDSAITYPTRSFAQAIGNVMTGILGSGSSATGFGINLSAYESAHYADCWFEDMQAGSRDAFEPVYSKSLRTLVTNCMFVDCHDEIGGGAIAFKGSEEDVQVAQWAIAHGCTFKGSSAGRLRVGVWAEADNVLVADCLYLGHIRAGVQTNVLTPGQTGLRVINNTARLNNCGGSEAAAGRSLYFVGITNNVTAGIEVSGNYIECIDDAVSGSDFKAIRIEAGNGETITAPIVKNNTVRKMAGMTLNDVQGIAIDKHAGGTLTDISLLGNHFEGLDECIVFTTSAPTGTIMQGNTSRGTVSADVLNTAAADITSWGNSWDTIGILHATVTAANLADDTHAINTAGKFRGKLVYETDNDILYMATGAAAASPWFVVADDTSAVTPTSE